MPYDRILDLMSPEGEPNLFVLGTYAKRVTIYTQQVRAINLVDAIQCYRRKLTGLRIAVVGGGISGLTAAARALEYGAAVTVFEQTADFLGIQSLADHRWVHPHIYDWPYGEGDPPIVEDAGLPVLTWSAQTASALSKTLLATWKTIAGNHSGRVRECRFTTVKAIRRNADSAWNLDWTRHDKTPPEPGTGLYDIVIVAIGYGLEPSEGGRDSYWQPEGRDWIGKPGEQRVLLAGYGDGALTDLIRFCLVKFDHATILRQVIQATTPADIATIRELEEDIRIDDAEELTDRYRQLDLPAVADVLRDKINPLRRIVLTGRGPNLFDPGASALNRLVTSQLLRLNAFRHIPLSDGTQIRAAHNDDPGVLKIRSQFNPPGTEFTDIVLRFGTSRILPPDPRTPLVASADGHPVIDGLPDTLAGLRRTWWEMTPANDPTRTPLWPLLGPVWQSSVALRASPPVPDNLGRYCLTIQPAVVAPRASWLPQLVTTAMSLLRQGRVLPFSPIPVALPLQACVSSPEALASTTRALCQAPIAIFALGPQMGQSNPAGMVLLGLRAAVRRGLTLVIHNPDDGELDWNTLPFNLKELLVLPIKEGEEDRLVNVIASGWSQLRAAAGTYTDLPVFDVVRKFERQTPRADRNRLEIFALCPFNRDYLDHDWPRLRSVIRQLGADDGKQFDVRPVTEYLSPLLVGERLYELTRFADRCIVDWTHWRANVFFELGVRLAVNPVPPICVIAQKDITHPRGNPQLLRTFDPIPYDLESNESEVSVKFNQAFPEAERGVRGSRARLSQVYAAAERNVALDQEIGRVPLDQELLRHVEAVIGPDIARTGGLRNLYHRNPFLAQQVWRDAIDRLQAARLLLEFKIEDARARGTQYDALESAHATVTRMLDDLLEVSDGTPRP